MTHVRLAAVLLFSGASALVACDAREEEAVAGQEASVTPTFVAGNPSCTSQGYDFGLKVEPVESGSYEIGDTGLFIDVTVDGSSFDFESDIGIDAVIVKGGPNSNVYVYDPPAESFGDTDLTAPINPENGQPYGLSHLEFCYDLELDVEKTADTSLTRTWDWSIVKTADQTSLLLSAGQIFTVNYEVTVDTVGDPVDSDWAVEGDITIHNPWPDDATITSVTDSITGIGAVTVDCGEDVEFPYVLAAGDTLVCTYESALPDGTTRTNTATVTTSGAIGGDDATASVDFSDPTVTGVDECVNVTDTLGGTLGEVCADDAPYTFEYSYDVGPFPACTQTTVENTATITETGDSDDWTVVVDVACEEGCTLTPGYWKTHSSYGPAPYDDTWDLVDEDAAFFLSGVSWYDALWTSPQGNAYWILAHAYIAAYLNVLNGADTTAAVDAAITAAEALFGTYTDEQVAAMKGNNATRAQFISLAATLDAYNNGLIGPGHCSE